MQSCDTCANCGPWRREPEGWRTHRVYVIADCNAPNVSEFWKMIGQKPAVMPNCGCGSECGQYKPRAAAAMVQP